MDFLAIPLGPSQVRRMDMAASESFKAVPFTGHLRQEPMRCVERFYRGGHSLAGKVVSLVIRQPVKAAHLMALAAITTFNLAQSTGHRIPVHMKCAGLFTLRGLNLDGNKAGLGIL